MLSQVSTRSALLLFVLLSDAVAKLPLPSYFTKCPSKERAKLNACAMENALSALSAIGETGDRKYGILPLDPAFILSILVKQNGLDLEFINVTIAAEPGYTPNEIDIDLERKHVKVVFSTPLATFTSMYRTEGRILVLSLKGNGNCKITLENYKAYFDTDFEIVKSSKDGEEYVKLLNQTLDATITKASYQFDNLFNGDPTLGKATNDFLNENWKDIFQETKAGTLEAIGVFTASIFQGLFGKVPYKDLFPS